MLLLPGIGRMTTFVAYLPQQRADFTAFQSVAGNPTATTTPVFGFFCGRARPETILHQRFLFLLRCDERLAVV